jgi:hypothetical protein
MRLRTIFVATMNRFAQFYLTNFFAQFSSVVVDLCPTLILPKNVKNLTDWAC